MRLEGPEGPRCRVKGCRYKHNHTTGGHECGRCGRFGHGARECRSPGARTHLDKFQGETLPKKMHCRFDCPFKALHTTDAHRCRSCKQYGHSVPMCATVVFPEETQFFLGENNNRHAYDLLADKPADSVVWVNAGMGCSFFYKKKVVGPMEVLFLHSDSQGQYNEDHRPDLDKFIGGADNADIRAQFLSGWSPPSAGIQVKCPLCREISFVEPQQVDVTGLTTECCACMDAKASVYLPKCGHVCLCRDCAEICAP